MSAEAIARLREKLESHDGDAYGPVNFDDLRALLDAHAALEAEFRTRAGEWVDGQRVFMAAEARVAELERALLDACREKALHGHTTTLLAESLRLKVPGTEGFEAWGEERESKLRTLEAAHTEALDALERAEKWMSKPLCEDGTCDGCVVRAVLAKAGRR